VIGLVLKQRISKVAANMENGQHCEPNVSASLEAMGRGLPN